MGQSPVVGPGDWARGLRPVTRSRAVARLAYDRASRWSRVEEPFERRAVAAGLGLLRVQPGERVLELGCGAGGALVALARAVGGAGRVVGLDLSPGMLRLAAARLRRAGLADRAELVVADATAVPFADASFDAVFMSFTLELFDTPEIPLVLAECRRVLRPGGRIGVVSLSRAAPVRWPTRLYDGSTTAFRRRSTAVRSMAASRSRPPASSRRERSWSRCGVSAPRRSPPSGRLRLRRPRVWRSRR